MPDTTAASSCEEEELYQRSRMQNYDTLNAEEEKVLRGRGLLLGPKLA